MKRTIRYWINIEILFQISILLVTFEIYTFQMQPFDLTVCYDNTSKLDIYINEPRVVDVIAGSTVNIWCHCCNAEGDFYPKLWFYKPRGKQFNNQKMEEIQSNGDITDKVSITLSHTLNLNNFNSNDSGIYTCKSYDGKNGNIFTYVLDGVTCVEITPKIGSASQWQEYKRTYIDPINKKMRLSDEEPYSTFRNKYDVILNVYTIWDNWSECNEIYGHQQGIRKRLGRCRVGPMTNNTIKNKLRNDSYDTLISYLTDGYNVPCRSIKLNESVPEISAILRDIPEFETEETCSNSKKTVKRKKNKENLKCISTRQVMEDSHVTLMCSEVVPNSDIKWFKDKKMLKSLYGNILNKRKDEPHVSIDANNSLHILRISKKEEGNYTCLMNGKKVNQFEVKVVSKSKLLNQEFIRYSIYLGFVLSLTMTCYCAGVCVAWHRRASFVDPLNLYRKKPYSYSKCEKKRLLG